MKITDVKIRKLYDEGQMKAVVSVTFDNALALHDIKVISTNDKTFVTMPSRRNPDGTFKDIAHPINSEFRREVNSAVLNAYAEALNAAELENVEE